MASRMKRAWRHATVKMTAEGELRNMVFELDAAKEPLAAVVKQRTVATKCAHARLPAPPPPSLPPSSPVLSSPGRGASDVPH